MAPAMYPALPTLFYQKKESSFLVKYRNQLLLLICLLILELTYKSSSLPHRWTTIGVNSFFDAIAQNISKFWSRSTWFPTE